MKRYLTLLALLTLSLLSAQNLLKNPVMKEVNANGTPVGWGVFPGTVLEGPGLDGADFTISKPEGKDATLTYHFKLESQVPYIMSLQFKGEKDAIVYAYVEWSVKKGNGVEHGGSYQVKNPGRTPVKPEWQTMTINFTLPDNLSSCYLALRSMNGKRLSFKNLAIRKGNIREEPNVGGFWNLDGLKKYDDKHISVQGGSSATLLQVPVTPGGHYRLSYDACGNGPVPADYPFHEIKTQITPKVQGTFTFNDVSNTPQRKWLSFSVPEDSDIKRVNVMFTVKANEAVSVDFSNFKLETFVPDSRDAWRVEVVKPFYRNTIYESQPVNDIVCDIYASGANAASCTVKLFKGGLSVKQAKTIATAKVPISATGKTTLTLPVKALPIGTYTLNILISDAKGVTQKAFVESIRKVPKAPVEIIGLPNRYFAINGKPFFPIMLWNMRSWEDDYLYYAARHGVNITKAHVMNTEEEMLEVLDKADKFGLKLIFNGGYSNKLSQEALDAFRAHLERRFTPAIRKHPAFFGYFMVDEPLWGGKPFLPLQVSFKVYQNFDPYHPTWINAAPRNEVEDLRPYGAACDIWGCDIYPVPSPNGHSGLEDKMMTSVGKYCTRMDEVTWHRKPIWMALQGFGWGENPECGPTGRAKIHPTLPQLRFMMFDAMLNGCTGFGLWGSQYVKDVTFAENLLVNCADVHQYSTLFIDGKQLPNAPSSDEAIRAQVIEYKGDLTHFIMGVENRKATGTVTVDGKPLTVLTSFGAKTTQNGNTLTVEMEPYGYAICATAPLPKPYFKLIPKVSKLEAHGSPIPAIIDKVLKSIEGRKSFKTNASWIWSPKNYDQAGSVCFIAKAFNAKAKDKALLRLAVDDRSTVFLNGKEIAKTQNWDQLFDIDLTPHLKNGENLLVIRAEDSGALPCGLLAELHVNGKVSNSDASWLSLPATSIKSQPPNSLKGFEKAKVITPYGGGAWRTNVQETVK